MVFGSFRSNKNGQLTLFIVIAIIFVVGIVSVVFLVSNLKDVGEPSPSASRDLQGFVERCLETTAEDCLTIVGRQGGYYRFGDEPLTLYYGDDGQPGPLLTNLGEINVSYYLYNSSNVMPSLDGIGVEISKYVEENLDSCINNFIDFEDRAYSVSSGRPRARTTIFDSIVKISLDYPVTISSPGGEVILKDYSSELEIRLGKFYDITKEIMRVQTLDPSNLCLNCLLEYKNNNFYTQLLIVENRTILFVVTDTERKLNDLRYDFIYANRY
jgi:hypothetical protein